MKKLAIIVPVHNESNNIVPLTAAIHETLSILPYVYDILFIDDGSADDTVEKIKKQQNVDDRISLVELSRNFGKDQALQAGLEAANADAVITIDADLQHPPQLMRDLIEYWENGYEVVYAYREKANTHTTKFQQQTSRFYYKVMNLLSDVEFEDGISDYRLLDRQVVEQLKQIDEYQFFFRGMVKWVGFRQIGIPYNPSARFAGEASYSLFKLFKLAINSTMAFSVRPLYLATLLGAFFSMLSLLYFPYVLISFLFGLDMMSGWASLIATVAFFGGLQLFVLGVIGMYVGKIFMQTKPRPNYIIRNTSHLDRDTA